MADLKSVSHSSGISQGFTDANNAIDESQLIRIRLDGARLYLRLIQGGEVPGNEQEAQQDVDYWENRLIIGGAR